VNFELILNVTTHGQTKSGRLFGLGRNTLNGTLFECIACHTTNKLILQPRFDYHSALNPRLKSLWAYKIRKTPNFGNVSKTEPGRKGVGYA